MGAMKRVRTAMTLKMWPADPEERSAFKAIVARDKQYKAHAASEASRKQERYNERDMIEAIYLRHQYVGSRPNREGQYQVYDTDTSSTKLVAISTANGGHLVAWALGEQRPVPLDDFNLRSYRWFRISYLTPEDQVMIRKLPLAKIQPAEVG